MPQSSDDKFSRDREKAGKCRGWDVKKEVGDALESKLFPGLTGRNWRGWAMALIPLYLKILLSSWGIVLVLFLYSLKKH